MWQTSSSLAVLIFIGCSSSLAWPLQSTVPQTDDTKPQELPFSEGTKPQDPILMPHVKKTEAQDISYFPGDEKWIEADRQKWNREYKDSSRQARKRQYVPLNSLTFMTANNEISPLDWHSANNSDIRHHIAGSKLAGVKTPSELTSTLTTTRPSISTEFHIKRTTRTPSSTAFYKIKTTNSPSSSTETTRRPSSTEFHDTRTTKNPLVSTEAYDAKKTRRPTSTTQFNDTWTTRKPSSSTKFYDTWTTRRSFSPTQSHKPWTTIKPFSPTQSHKTWTTRRPTSSTELYDSRTTKKPSSFTETYDTRTTRRPPPSTEFYDTETTRRPSSPTEVYDTWTTRRISPSTDFYSTMTTKPSISTDFYNTQTTRKPSPSKEPSNSTKNTYTPSSSTLYTSAGSVTEDPSVYSLLTSLHKSHSTSSLDLTSEQTKDKNSGTLIIRDPDATRLPSKVITFIPSYLTTEPKNKTSNKLLTWRPAIQNSQTQNRKPPPLKHTTKRPSLIFMGDRGVLNSTLPSNTTVKNTPQLTSKNYTKSSTKAQSDTVSVTNTTAIDLNEKMPGYYIPSKIKTQVPLRPTQVPDHFSSKVSFRPLYPHSTPVHSMSSSHVGNTPAAIKNEWSHPTRLDSFNVNSNFDISTTTVVPEIDKLVIHEAFNKFTKLSTQYIPTQSPFSDVTVKPITFIEEPSTVGLSNHAAFDDSISKPILSQLKDSKDRVIEYRPAYDWVTIPKPSARPHLVPVQASSQHDGQTDFTGNIKKTTTTTDHPNMEDTSVSEYEYDFYEDNLSSSLPSTTLTSQGAYRPPIQVPYPHLMPPAEESGHTSRPNSAVSGPAVEQPKNKTKKNSHIVVKIWSLVDGQLQLAGSQRVPISELEKAGLSLDQNSTKNDLRIPPCNSTSVTQSYDKVPQTTIFEDDTASSEGPFDYAFPIESSTATSSIASSSPGIISSYMQSHGYDIHTSASSFPSKNSHSSIKYISQNPYPNGAHSSLPYYQTEATYTPVFNDKTGNEGQLFSHLHHILQGSPNQDTTQQINKGQLNPHYVPDPQHTKSPHLQTLLQNQHGQDDSPLLSPYSNVATTNQPHLPFSNDFSNYLTLLQLLSGINLARPVTIQNYAPLRNSQADSFHSSSQLYHLDAPLNIHPTHSQSFENLLQSTPPPLEHKAKPVENQSSFPYPTIDIPYEAPPLPYAWPVQSTPAPYKLEQEQPNISPVHPPTLQVPLNFNPPASHFSLPSTYNQPDFYNIKPESTFFKRHSLAPSVLEKNLHSPIQVLSRSPQTTLLSNSSTEFLSPDTNTSSEDVLNSQEGDAGTEPKSNPQNKKQDDILQHVSLLDEQSTLSDVIYLLEILHKIQTANINKHQDQYNPYLQEKSPYLKPLNQSTLSDILEQLSVHRPLTQNLVQNQLSLTTQASTQLLNDFLPFYHGMSPVIVRNNSVTSQQTFYNTTNLLNVTQAVPDVTYSYDTTTSSTTDDYYAVDNATTLSVDNDKDPVSNTSLQFSQAIVNSTNASNIRDDDYDDAVYLTLASPLIVFNSFNVSENISQELPVNTILEISDQIVTTPSTVKTTSTVQTTSAVQTSEVWKETPHEDYETVYSEWPSYTSETPVTEHSYIPSVQPNSSLVDSQSLPQTTSPAKEPIFGGIGNPSLLGVPIALHENSYVVPTVKPQTDSTIQLFGGVGNPALEGHPLIIGGKFGNNNDDSDFIAFKNPNSFLKGNYSAPGNQNLEVTNSYDSIQHSITVHDSNEYFLDTATVDAYTQILHDLQQLEILENLLADFESDDPQTAETIRLIAMEAVLARNPLLVKYLTRVQSTPRQNPSSDPDSVFDTFINEILHSSKIQKHNTSAVNNTFSFNNLPPALIKALISTAYSSNQNGHVDNFNNTTNSDHSQEPLTYLIQGTDNTPPSLQELQSALQQHLKQSITFQDSTHIYQKSNHTLYTPYPNDPSSASFSDGIVKPLANNDEQSLSDTKPTDPLTNEAIAKCLENTWCAFSLALSVGVGAAGAMAAPFVVPVLGRKRRDLTGNFSGHEPVLHVITNLNPKVNIYAALVKKPEESSNDKSDTRNEQFHSNSDYQSKTDDIAHLISDLYKEFNLTKIMSFGLKYQAAADNVKDQEEDNISRLMSSLIEEYNLTMFMSPDLGPQYEANADHESDFEKSDDENTSSIAEYDSEENPPSFFMPPPKISPLEIVDRHTSSPGVERNSTFTGIFSTVPGFNKAKNVVKRTKKKRKPTKAPAERKRRVYDCFSSETCSIGVALAMAVVPLLAAPFLGRRKRSLEDGKQLGERIQSVFRSLEAYDSQFITLLDKLSLQEPRPR